MLGEITFGQVAASLFYVQLFFWVPCRSLAICSRRYATGSASAQRIFLLLDTEPEIRDRQDALHLDDVRMRCGIQGDVTFAL